MNKEVQNKKLKDLYHRVGLKYNLNGETIRKIVESPYEFTKVTTDSIDLSKIETEEDFNKTKTNFLYKFLGKIYTSWGLIERKQKQSKAFKLINKEKWEKK